MVEYNGTNIPPEIVASLPTYYQAQIPLWNETRQSNLYASIGICVVLAIVSVWLRLYSRRLKGQSLLVDDYVVVFALVGGHFDLTISCLPPFTIFHEMWH